VQVQMQIQLATQSMVPYAQPPMAHAPTSMCNMSACCGGSVVAGSAFGNGIGTGPGNSHSYGGYGQSSWEAPPGGSAGQPASMQGGFGSGNSGGGAGAKAGSGLVGYAADGRQSYGGMDSCGISGSLNSMRQADERAAAEALWTQQMPRNGSSCGVPPGSGTAASDTLSLPAGLAAGASQFGMSANAPAFTPGLGIGASGSSGATTGTVGVSFEADSLRAAAETLWADTGGGAATTSRLPQSRFTVPDMNRVPSLQAMEAESMRAAAAGLWGQQSSVSSGAATNGAIGGFGVGVPAGACASPAMAPEASLALPPLPSGMLGGGGGLPSDLLAGLRLDSIEPGQ